MLWQTAVQILTRVEAELAKGKECHFDILEFLASATLKVSLNQCDVSLAHCLRKPKIVKCGGLAAVQATCCFFDVSGHAALAQSQSALEREGRHMEEWGEGLSPEVLLLSAEQ